MFGQKINRCLLVILNKELKSSTINKINKFQTCKLNTLSSIDTSKATNKEDSSNDGEKKVKYKRFFEIAEPKLNKPSVFLNASFEERRRMIQLFLDVQKESGLYVPDNLDDDFWDRCLNEASFNKAKSQAEFDCQKAFQKKKNKEESQLKLERRKEEAKLRLDRSNENPNEILTSYPGHKTIFRHLSSANDTYYARAAAAMRLPDTPKIIFDFQFEVNSSHTSSTLVRQFNVFYSQNMRSNEPFAIHLCNLKENSLFRKTFKRHSISIEQLFVDETDKHYLELLPKEELVYLSPNAKTNMKYYDPNKTYIIGVLADVGHQNYPYTYEQAKIDGIQCERLPLDQFIRFQGSKELCINQVGQILYDLKEGGNWRSALRHVPNRKKGI